MTKSGLVVALAMALGVATSLLGQPGGIIDSRPPLKITISTYEPKTLTWTAPGDDGNVGTAAEYDIRYATYPITDSNWMVATQVADEPIPDTAGTTQSYTFPDSLEGGTHYAAIKTRDEAFNWSGLSNVVSFEIVQPTHISVYQATNDSLYSIPFPPVPDWLRDTTVGALLAVSTTTYDSMPIPGDVTGDREVKLSDVIFLINYVLKDGTAPPQPDPFQPKVVITAWQDTDSLYLEAPMLIIRRR